MDQKAVSAQKSGERSQKRRLQIFLPCVGNSLLRSLWFKNMLLRRGPIIHGVTGLHFGPVELSI